MIIINIQLRESIRPWISHTLRKNDREPTRLQKDRKAKEWLVEKQISRSWEKELEEVETYCQRQEKMEGTHRQPMFLMEGWTLLLLFENERHPESILELQLSSLSTSV
jgi:hypothetical protein